MFIGIERSIEFYLIHYEIPQLSPWYCRCMFIFVPLFLQTALEILGWNQEEARFPLEGRVLFTQPNDANWKKVWTVKMTSIQALLCVLSPDELPEVTSNKELIFPPESSPIKDASLIMVREKNAKYTLVRVSFMQNSKEMGY